MADSLRALRLPVVPVEPRQEFAASLLRRLEHLASQVMDNKVQAIADPQDGQAQRENPRVRGRSIRVVDRGGATGEDQPKGTLRLNLGDRGGTRQHNREDILFSNTASDQLGILGAEVEDEDAVLVDVGHKFSSKLQGARSKKAKSKYQARLRLFLATCYLALATNRFCNSAPRA